MGYPLQARGDYAARYADEIGELPERLGKLGVACRRCAETLMRYAGSLDEGTRTQVRSAVMRADPTIADHAGVYAAAAAAALSAFRNDVAADLARYLLGAEAP